MRRLLLVIALACTLTACGEGSDEAALRTTTTEAPTAPNPAGAEGVFSTPAEAVEGLRAAWEIADAPAANIAATAEVTDRLFQAPFSTVQEKGLQFDGCDDVTPATTSSLCRYHYEGGDLRFTTTKANDTWKVTGLEQPGA